MLTNIFYINFQDSFIFSARSKDFYKDLGEMADVMDFSNLSEGHILKNDLFRKKLNRFKLETPNYKILEGVSLRAKVYALKSKYKKIIFL